MVGEDYSSKFSAWLALGCISPRIYQEIKRYENENGANESTWLVLNCYGVFPIYVQEVPN
jgi:deoxyribodipyrimidine photo-lyase